MKRSFLPLAFAIQIFAILFSYVLWSYRLPILLPDSGSYLNFLWSFPEIFTQTRTLGYPVFLYFLRAVNPQLTGLPFVQLVIHMGAVILFGLSLRRFGFSRVMTAVSASPLFYAVAIRNNVANVLTDALGATFAIVVVSFVLLTVRFPTRAWSWAGLAASLFIDYSIRPAYLFLVGVAPLLIFVVAFLRWGVTRFGRIWKSLMVRAFVSCVVPLLLFSGLRWVTVGEFGLVPFGGYNFVGLMAESIGPEDVAKLSPEFQPLTNWILQEQRRRNMIRFNENGQRLMSYRDVMNNYNIYVHEVILPYLTNQEMTAAPVVNDFLMRFSEELLALHRDFYWHWLRSALGFTLGRIPDPMTMGFLGIILTFLYVVKVGLMRYAKLEPGMVPRWDVAVMVAIGLIFFMSKTLLVILIEVPIDRYIEPCYLFFPAMLLSVMVGQLSTIWRLGHHNQGLPKKQRKKRIA